MSDATTRAYLAQLAAQLREAGGYAPDKHIGKRERKVAKAGGKE